MTLQSPILGRAAIFAGIPAKMLLNGDESMFEQELQRKTEEINKMLNKYLPQETGYAKTVKQAVNYSLLAGGKRLRPLFLLETGRLFLQTEAKDELLESYAAAIEMIHTYSLVHDDLPAMDDDRYRRGKLTTHAKYGEAMGILAGDALLNLAFETMTAALAAEAVPQRQAAGIRAMQIISSKSGMYGMLGGQVADVEKTGTPLQPEELDFIYRLKTGALLEAAMMAGGILAGAEKEQVQLLERAAAAVGMAFQIQDDILDVTSSTEVLGKPVHSDEKNEKYTFVTLHTMSEALARVEELSHEAVELLESLPGNRQFLTELVLSLIHRTR